MIAHFLKELEQVFGWLLAASWQASVLALLVLALQRALRGRLNPRWRYALWLLVVLRLALPVEPESALSLFQFTPRPPAAIMAPVTEPLFAQAVSPSPVTVSAGTAFAEPVHPLSVYSLLAVAWMCGAVFLLVLTWYVNLRFARQVADSPGISDSGLLELFAAARAELGIHRTIHLVENGQVQSPAIMGLFRPTLLLPARVREQFDPAELRLIFLHELAHLKRGDVVAQALIALLQILHWFNPVLWFTFRRMRLDREPATDALVLSRAGEEEKERYGLMLIKLLEHFNQRHSLPTLVGIMEDKDQFKQRFSLIARFTRGAYGWSLLGLAVMGALAVVGLTGTAADKTPASTESAGDKRFDELFNQLRIENLKVQDMPLDEFVQKISKELAEKDPQKKGLNFVLKIPPGEPPIRVSLDFTKIPGYRANISMILGPLKASYPIRYSFKQEGSCVYIEQISRDEVTFNKKASTTFIDIDFSHVDPATALQTVQAASAGKGFKFDLDLKAIKDLPAIDLKAGHVGVDQALRSIFYLADLHPEPLEHFAGYKVEPQSPDITKSHVNLFVGTEIVSFKIGDEEVTQFRDNMLKMSPNWGGPSVHGAAFSPGNKPFISMWTWPEETESHGTITKEFRTESKVIGKTRIQVTATMEIKDSHGNSLGKASGHATMTSGEEAQLLGSTDFAALSLPGKGNDPALGFVGAMHIALVNEDGQPLLPNPPTVREFHVSSTGVDSPSPAPASPASPTPVANTYGLPAYPLIGSYGEVVPSASKEINDELNNLTLSEMDVTGMPLESFLSELARLLKKNNPDSKEIVFPLMAFQPLQPDQVTFHLHHKSTLREILNQLAVQYPMRYKIRGIDDIIIWQLSQTEVDFNKKARETKIDVDLNQTTPGAALRAVQAAAAAKGFTFKFQDIDEMQNYKPNPPHLVTLQQKQIDVQQALRSILEMGHLRQYFQGDTLYVIRDTSISW